MRKILVVCLAAVSCVACANTDGTGSSTAGAGQAQLEIFNATVGSPGAHLTLDGQPASFPGFEQFAALTVAAGSHQFVLTSSTGQPLVAERLTFDSGTTQLAAFTGIGSASVEISVASDTISNTLQASVGSVLMVNTVPASGPFDLVIHQLGTDSVYRFGNFSYGAGSLPPPSPYGFYIPFVPGTYTVDVTSPGSNTGLAMQRQFTLAAGEKWTIVLDDQLEGSLNLQAIRQ